MSSRLASTRLTTMPSHNGNARTADDSVDVLIVGAGPAGLFCALSVLQGGVGRVMLIDRGAGIGERSQHEAAAQKSYESGIGGAGLYSDGKLCMSLDVGGHLETYLQPKDRQALLTELTRMFADVLPELDIGSLPGPPLSGFEAARSAGLKFKYYPVLHIGTDRCTLVIRRLVDKVIGGGGELFARTRLSRLTVDPETGAKLATLDGPDGEVQVVQAREVVLAMGKVGAHEQAKLCESLGVPSDPQPVYIGARLETDAPVLAPLFDGVRDPKYNLPFPDGTKLKTHCASQNGAILELRYGGLPLAGGHASHAAPTGRSGFALLWNGWTSNRPFERAQKLMQRCAELTGGPLLVQSHLDLLAGQTSTPGSLNGTPLTDPSAVAGDLRDLLPADYFWRCDALLRRLELLCPDIYSERTVLYGPAIEWWMRRSRVVDGGMQTRVPGLSVCGDGSGWSQGIVHSAATGMVVGRAIATRSGRVPSSTAGP